MLVRQLHAAEAIELIHRDGDRLLIGNADQGTARIGFDGPIAQFKIVPSEQKLRLNRKPMHQLETLRHWFRNCANDAIRREFLAAMATVIEENRGLL